MTGRKPRTWRRYAMTLVVWLNFLDAVGRDWTEATPQDVEAFKDWRLTDVRNPERIMPGSFDTDRAALNTFYSWASGAYALVNPVPSVSTAEEDERQEQEIGPDGQRRGSSFSPAGHCVRSVCQARPVDTMAKILKTACGQLGIDATDAEGIRQGENAIYRLPGAVVVRIARVGQHEVAAREIRVARWLAENGVAAVEALPVEQPLLVESRPVTFWKELPPHRPGTPVETATILRQLHGLPVPADRNFGRLAPFVRLRERLTTATVLMPDDREWVLGHLAALESRWADGLPTGLSETAVHGDLWSGNLAVSDDGVVRLLDLERFSVGRPEWDLVSTAIKYTSFNMISQADYQAFTQTYGVDVTEWPGYPLLRDIRELRMMCYLAQLATEQPQFTSEALLRVDCLRGRRGPRPWTWTASP
ncbi:phosphotransferase [Streptomyces bluensis]|uniref:phosphotransferase n=1 Tax=Streptomyces bluensis TaxID=33897 RepID=UPI001E3E4980|nr:phosphotransferase [Streptomyces bluensis]